MAEIDKSKKLDITFSEYSLQSEKSFNLFSKIRSVSSKHQKCVENNCHHIMFYLRILEIILNGGLPNADGTNRITSMDLICIYILQCILLKNV